MTLMCVNKILTWITRKINYQFGWHYHYWYYYYYYYYSINITFFFFNRSPIARYTKSETEPTIVLMSNIHFINCVETPKGMYCHNCCFVLSKSLLSHVLCQFFPLYHTLFCNFFLLFCVSFLFCFKK